MAVQTGIQIVTILVLVQFASHVNCQIPYFGKCPSVVPMQDFMPTQLSNKTWYLIEKYPILSEIISKCNLIRFEYNSDLSLTLYTQHTQPVTGFIKELHAVANPDNILLSDGRYFITYLKKPFEITVQYIVLDTDYQNYAVMYSCVDYTIFNFRYVWIYTAGRTPSPEYLAKANTVVYNNGLDTVKYLKHTDQSNCHDFGTV